MLNIHCKVVWKLFACALSGCTPQLHAADPGQSVLLEIRRSRSPQGIHIQYGNMYNNVNSLTYNNNSNIMVPYICVYKRMGL